MVRFGPSGNDEAFYNEGFKKTSDCGISLNVHIQIFMNIH